MFKKEVKFLGHRVSKDGIRLDEDKVKAVQELTPPKTVREVQCLLGSLNFYRKFIKGFSFLASPLYNLLKKGTKFLWTEDCSRSFTALKKALISSPVLALPDTSDKNQSYEVTVDSSKRGQGATLTQEIDGVRRTVAYWSRAVPRHQQRMGATRLELIALHGAIMNWKIFLQGTKFLVKTDCRALLSLSKIFKNENSYFQRRLADLASFDFEIKHISGQSSDIKMADFLSRYGFNSSTKDASTQTDTSSEKDPQIHEILRISEAERSKTVTIDEIKREYSNDRVLSQVIEWVKDGSRPQEINHRSAQRELSHYWKNFNLLTMEDGVLYRSWIDPVENTRKPLIVVPNTLVERILYTFHDTLATCHAGVAACVERCRKQFYFYKLKYEFELYIGSCITCARAKQPKAYLRAALKRSVYTEWNQAISIDHLEPSKLPTRNGTVALFTICDMFSGYISCVPVSSTSTEASVKALLENWILRFGMPGTIQHDLGSGFTSALWKAIMKAFDIKDAKTTPKMSQANGKAEACNRKINQAMRVTLSPSEFQEYDVYIKYIVFCLNSLVSSKTGFTPYFLVHGRECRMPRDLMVQDDTRLDEVLMADEDINYKTRKQAYDLYRRVSEITRIARDNSERRARYIETQYNKRLQGPYFSVGDMCLLLDLYPKHKYSKKFQGPFQVKEKINDHNYIVEVNGKNKVVSISKMKWYPKDSKYNRAQVTPLMEDDKTTAKTKDTLKGRVTAKMDDSNSSSDEDDVIITLNQPTNRRRSLRIAAKNNKNGESLENGAAATTTAGDEANIQERLVISDDNHVAEDTMRTTELNIPEAAEINNHEVADAQEALNDANADRQEETPSTANTDSNSSNTTEIRFRSIDTPISLSDVNDHERKKGIGSVSSSSSTMSRINTRYNLRPRPGQTARSESRCKPKTTRVSAKSRK